MTEAGFFEPKRLSPTSLGIVIALHAALIAVAAMSKIEVIRKTVSPTVIDWIPIPKEPPPEVPPASVEKATKLQVPESEVVVPQTNPDISLSQTTDSDEPISIPPLPPVPQPIEPPRIEPVRVAAILDPRFADRLKPPYPLDEQRMGREGYATLEVVIGTDGKVKSASKVEATSESFFKAAQQQALAKWRFRPATVDGRPVESRKTLTIRFKLDSADV